MLHRSQIHVMGRKVKIEILLLSLIQLLQPPSKVNEVFYLLMLGNLEEDDEVSSCRPNLIMDRQAWIAPSLKQLLPQVFSRRKLNYLTCNNLINNHKEIPGVKNSG